jgi:putative colanic acid biosynthesis UDP-glucose lipid carrier transferase
MAYDRQNPVSLGATNGWTAILSTLIPPTVATASLYGIAAISSVEMQGPYAILALLTFIVTLVVYREMSFHMSGTHARSVRDFLQRSITAWAIVIACLAVLGFLLQYGDVLSRRIMLTWAIVTPATIATVQYWGHSYTLRARRRRKVVIAGVSDLSRRLAESIENPALGCELMGWFDDRGAERTGTHVDGSQVLGRLTDLSDFVKHHQIDVIYIALPIRHEERTKRLLDELHDTTASIYFVPDIFVFDLIQSRVDMIQGIPTVALCETPFYGMNGLVKRSMDLLIGSILLILTSPLMLAVAIGVAFTSRGSIIFKQRRYGLDGHEINVFKFRTMTSSDDGSAVKQAERGDSRLTPLGGLLRRLSIDELPQLFNVLGGSMSLVGPRPHAVAHNEQYRRLIKGYMIRHKVQPGITGLAQIRGHRGETRTVEEMQARVESDLEYLRRWSFTMDLKIIALTIVQLWRDRKAY